MKVKVITEIEYFEGTAKDIFNKTVDIIQEQFSDIIGVGADNAIFYFEEK